LFTGNPAAVVFAFHSDAMMLDIASENNLSEVTNGILLAVPVN
jgi:predicted PhzF superfamily epimerase YddE/YHI9